MYKTRLDELLNKIIVDDVYCINCVHHTDMISVLYNDVISAYITASDHIPTTTRVAKKIKPGCNENVKKFKNKALTWQFLWNSNDCPSDGYFAEQRRVSVRYYRAISLLGTLSEMQTKREW